MGWAFGNFLRRVVHTAGVVAVAVVVVAVDGTVAGAWLQRPRLLQLLLTHHHRHAMLRACVARPATP